MNRFSLSINSDTWIISNSKEEKKKSNTLWYIPSSIFSVDIRSENAELFGLELKQVYGLKRQVWVMPVPNSPPFFFTVGMHKFVCPVLIEERKIQTFSNVYSEICFGDPEPLVIMNHQTTGYKYTVCSTVFHSSSLEHHPNFSRRI